MTAAFAEKITVPAIKSARGAVALPGSKSISNRALLIAALADGTTHLNGLLRADDTDRMIDSLKKLGVGIRFVSETEVFVEGCAGKIMQKSADLFVGNAGTAARSLTALLAFAGGNYRLDGVERMRERPIGDLVEALCRMGADITYEIREGFPPLLFKPAHSLKNRICVRGNVSSQYLTAILLTAPIAAPAEGLEIVIEGELISKPYVEMTVRMMRDFGAQVNETPQGYRVMPGFYRAKDNYLVEADASGASYFLALGALASGPVMVTGVGRNSIQGDIVFAEALSRMGASVVCDDGSITVSCRAATKLNGLQLDCTAIPDAAMTFVPMALCCEGEIHLTGIASWRVKETDRLAALACEMRKFGAVVKEGQDWIRVCKPADGSIRDAEVDTYDDHRMAMSLALAACAGVSVTVRDPKCTAKTFPDFFDKFFSLVRS